MGKNRETHYTVLNVNEDCSAKDIKDAFIALSKKYHPDRTKDKSCHELFLKINEAYNVLNKTESRRLYDQHLLNNQDRVYHHYYENVYTTRSDPSFWESRAKGTGFAQGPYYGIKGIKRVSNSVIVLICFAVAGIGLGLETILMRKSFTIDREHRRQSSARNEIFLEYARNQAVNNGNDVQIQNFREDLLRGGNERDINEEYRRRLRETGVKADEKDVSE